MRPVKLQGPGLLNTGDAETGADAKLQADDCALTYDTGWMDSEMGALLLALLALGCWDCGEALTSDLDLDED